MHALQVRSKRYIPSEVETRSNKLTGSVDLELFLITFCKTLRPPPDGMDIAGHLTNLAIDQLAHKSTNIVVSEINPDQKTPYSLGVFKGISSDEKQSDKNVAEAASAMGHFITQKIIAIDISHFAP